MSAELSTHNRIHLLADMTTGLSDGIVVLLALVSGLGRVVENINSLYIASIVAIITGAAAIAISRYFTEKEGVEENAHEQHEIESLKYLGLTETTRMEIAAEMQKEEKSEFEKLVDASVDIAEAKKSALNIALFYAIGGLFPLLPYILINDRQSAFISSAVIAVLCLVLVGYIKALERNRGIAAEIFRQSITGILAATAGYLLGGVFL